MRKAHFVVSGWKDTTGEFDTPATVTSLQSPSVFQNQTKILGLEKQGPLGAHSKMVYQRDWILITASPWSQKEAERQQVGRLLAPSGILVYLHDKSPCPDSSAVTAKRQPQYPPWFTLYAEYNFAVGAQFIYSFHILTNYNISKYF